MLLKPVCMKKEMSELTDRKHKDDLNRLLILGEALIEKHLRDGPNSCMELPKIAKVKYSISLIKDKYKEVERYKKLWMNATYELDELLTRENSLEENFRESVESLVSKLPKKR